MKRLLAFVSLGCLMSLATARADWPDAANSEYLQLDGIQSVGAQFICSDFIPSSTDIIEAKVRLSSLSGNQCIWCARADLSVETQTTFYMSGKGFRFDRHTQAGAETYDELTPQVWVDYVLKANYAKCEIFLNGTKSKKALKEGAFDQKNPLAFFASYSPGLTNNFASLTFYYARVWNKDGDLQREYLPAKRIADGKLGLYETQEGKFFTNVRTGDFIQIGGEVVVTPVPEPDGSYLFGTNLTFAVDKASNPTAFYCKNTVYCNFSSIVFPNEEPPTVRFTGSVIADGQLPSGATIDTTDVKYLALAGPSLFPEGETISIPSGASFYFMPGFFVSYPPRWQYIKQTVSLNRDLELNGTWYVAEKYPQADLYGSLSGAGKIRTDNFQMKVYLRGDLAFNGEVQLSGGNCGTRLFVNSPHVTGKIEKVSMDAFSNTGTWWSMDDIRCGSYLIYDPTGDGPHDPLRIKEWATAAGGFIYNPSNNVNRMWRYGNSLLTWNDNRVSIDKVSGSGAIHVVADNEINRLTRNKSGDANLDIGEVTSTAKLYLSTNVFLTVGKVTAGATFDYACESNAVTTATLDITNGCSTAAIVKASDIAMLPARMTGFTGSVNLIRTEALNYPVTIDFDSEVYNYGGTDGSGTLAAAPATGHIEVAFKGTPVKGDYALARFTEGGEKLAAWTVTAPNFYDGFTVDVVKDSTGIWLAVHKTGMLLFLK